MSIRQNNTGQSFKQMIPERQTGPVRPTGMVGEEAAESSGVGGCVWGVCPACAKSFPLPEEAPPLGLPG